MLYFISESFNNLKVEGTYCNDRHVPSGQKLRKKSLLLKNVSLYPFFQNLSKDDPLKPEWLLYSKKPRYLSFPTIFRITLSRFACTFNIFHPSKSNFITNENIATICSKILLACFYKLSLGGRGEKDTNFQLF